MRRKQKDASRVEIRWQEPGVRGFPLGALFWTGQCNGSILGTSARQCFLSGWRSTMGSKALGMLWGCMPRNARMPHHSGLACNGPRALTYYFWLGAGSSTLLCPSYAPLPQQQKRRLYWRSALKPSPAPASAAAGRAAGRGSGSGTAAERLVGVVRGLGRGRPQRAQRTSRRAHRRRAAALSRR